MAPGRGLGGGRGDAGEVDLPQTVAEISGALIRREPLVRFRVRQEQLRSFRLSSNQPRLFFGFCFFPILPGVGVDTSRDAVMSPFISQNPGNGDAARHAGKVERRASVWHAPIFHSATLQIE